jgi:hypothetical protein
MSASSIQFTFRRFADLAPPEGWSVALSEKKALRRHAAGMAPWLPPVGSERQGLGLPEFVRSASVSRACSSGVSSGIMRVWLRVDRGRRNVQLCSRRKGGAAAGEPISHRDRTSLTHGCQRHRHESADTVRTFNSANSCPQSDREQRYNYVRGFVVGAVGFEPTAR